MKTKPCPFCGGSKFDLIGLVKTKVYYILCTNEKCFADGPIRSTNSKAIEAWNKRVGE